VNDLVLVVKQVEYEQKQFRRNPASAFFAVFFPIMFLVIFGSINRNSRVELLGNINFNQYYIPSILAFGVMGATYTNLAVLIAIRRDSGVLKRLRGTPLPRWVFLAGIIGNAILVSFLLVAVTTAVGVLFYGVTAYPERWLGLALDVTLGGLSFCALGLAVASLVPNAEAAPAVVNAIFLPLVFISGTFFYLDPSSVLARVADFFPVKHFIGSTFTAFDPRHGGFGADGRDLLVLAAWGLGAALLALRRFRWEPARR